METKFKIIETKDYVLAVSNEEAKEREICVDIDEFYSTPILNIAYRKNIRPDSIKQFKVVAFQPKNIAPELLFNAKLQSDNNTNLQKVAGLPLLPEIVVKDDVQNFIAPLLKKKGDENNTIDLNAYALGLIDAYKSATKKYSEEDLREAFRLGHFIEREGYKENFEKFIQSLKQSKTPKWFAAEIIDEAVRTKEDINGENGFEYITKLKTTTINGKTYLVGKYLYE